MSFRRLIPCISGLLIVLALAACNGQPSATPTPELTATVTQTPPRTLTVCLGAEPDSLFPLNNNSSAARSVLAAIYDGPIDTNSYSYQPVLLEQIPSLENGDAQLFETSVYVGDEVVDADGTPVTLAPGMRIRPAGCRSENCVVDYDGTSEIKMDQMQATFRLQPGLVWSDGEPLTAADSVYAFNLDANPAVPGSNYLIDRTQSYEAADDLTAQWWGRPGFVDPTYFTNIWMPLPEHLWGEFPANEVADEVSRSPIGWGPYVLEEWVDGDHITLSKNVRYFRSAEGLPKFDTVIFRFVPDPETAISGLLAGTCDILDPSIHLEGQAGLLTSMDEQGQLQALITQTPVMEQLAFGIIPASYDNTYNPQYDRLNYFGDVRVRQAIALCLDRQQVVDSVLGGLTSVPATYLPAEHPLFNNSVATYSYNVAAANTLLAEAGWQDTDGDPATPRVARGIYGIPNDTPFAIHYLTTSAVQRQQTAELLTASLAQCGIKADLEVLDQTTFYAAGPDGLLFGRQFDLAAFAMGSTGIETSCDWFTTSEVPNDGNGWIGTNISGYSSLAFDAACQIAQQSFPDETAHAEAYFQAQSIFSEELPVLPLYWRVKVAAARSDLCNFALDPTSSASLWNIEQIDSGAGCLP